MSYYNPFYLPGGPWGTPAIPQYSTTGVYLPYPPVNPNTGGTSVTPIPVMGGDNTGNSGIKRPPPPNRVDPPFNSRRRFDGPSPPPFQLPPPQQQQQQYSAPPSLPYSPFIQNSGYPAYYGYMSPFTIPFYYGPPAQTPVNQPFPVLQPGVSGTPPIRPATPTLPLDRPPTQPTSPTLPLNSPQTQPITPTNLPPPVFTPPASAHQSGTPGTSVGIPAVPPPQIPPSTSSPSPSRQPSTAPQIPPLPQSNSV
jgi:hypothetical protein